jgi:hypothetical protein
MQHQETVLLSPTGTVPLWVGWWREERGRLEEMAAAVSESEGQELPMGMTCI